MKKILSLLSALSLTAPLVTAVQSCSFGFKFNLPLNHNSSGKDNDEATLEQSESKVQQIKNRESDKVLVTDSSTSSTSKNSRIIVTSPESEISSLATKDLMSSKLTGGTKFTPYADTGIVEDTAEYAMKQKSVGSGHKEEVEKKLGDNNINNIDYSLGGYIEHAGSEYQGVKLGFMQNASDTGELMPMWNAAPTQMSTNPNSQGILDESGKGTEYANWFNERIDGWLNDENAKDKDVTISFGPFANSFWHTAWQNNKTPQELAESIAKIGERYGTQKFEFYFAAPYLTANGDYYDSQSLLASALKLLLETDPEYDFTLALVTSTRDGVATSGDTNGMIFGDEASPLYVFTKYLGMNFRLNLVPYLTVSDWNQSAPDADWEETAIEGAIEATNKTWRETHKKVNGVDISDVEVYKRMGVTPWIGRRAEAATYSFTPMDAVKLRTFAEEKGLGNISMFYISRDVPSEFLQNKEPQAGKPDTALADTNALDQNIRSGMGYAQYSFADALSGKTKEIANTTEATNKEGIEKLGGIDYWDMLNSVDGIYEEGGDWVTPGDPTPNPGGENGNGGGTIEGPNLPDTTPEGMGTSMLTSWTAANPNRKSTITEQSTKNKDVYFSPYMDAGLYSGNDVSSIVNKSGLDHLTLAFVQQANANNDTMELSIAGQSTTGDGYTWWEESQLWGKLLKPFADANKLQNVKTAYGGATTGGFYDKNPWDFAQQKTSTTEEAVTMLETGLVGFQQSLQNLAISKGATNAKMSKSIDFDIEGAAQSRDAANEVLAKTLAKMKKADKEWDFSITLPVLPTGLTSVGYNVMDTFVKAYKEAGLSMDDLPIINLMLMDYGDPIYRQAIADGKTNFDLAKDAIVNTRNNLATSVLNNYGTKVTGDYVLLDKIGATPMIGVNDTVWGVFTEEDAKELYNFAHEVGLGYLSMWSMNDDRGKDFYSGKNGPKSLLSHGLTYLNEYDFAKAFTGNWDADLKNPNK